MSTQMSHRSAATVAPLGKRPGADGYLLCHLLERRAALLPVPTDRRYAMLVADNRLRSLLYIAHVALRRHGYDLRFDAEFNLARRNQGLSFFSSVAVGRAFEAGLEQGWIHLNDDFTETLLTPAGRRTVLESGAWGLHIPWTDRVEADGKVGRPDMIIPISDPRVLAAIERELAGLFTAPIRDLRNRVLSAAAEVANSCDPGGAVRFVTANPSILDCME